MKQTEKVAVVRVINDLILADGIFDTREMDLLDRLRAKYGVKKSDILLADECTLAEAMDVLSEADDDLRHDLLKDCMCISMSDNICAREEAMLMLALRSCLTQNLAGRDSVISVRGNQRINLESFQVLYVESEYDEEVNASISRQYREICSELRLTGFDFVYLPQIARNYQKMSDEELLKLGYFLYPQVSDERLRVIIMQLRELSTARFCREQLSMKLDFKGLVDVAPSILFKIKESLVDNEQVSNFMLLEISDNALDTVREMIDLFLMSDGVSDAKFETTNNLKNPQKWDELWENFEHEGVGLTTGEEVAKKQLLSWLDFWSPGNYDDRTIAVLCSKEAPSSGEKTSAVADEVSKSGSAEASLEEPATAEATSAETSTVDAHSVAPHEEPTTAEAASAAKTAIDTSTDREVTPAQEPASEVLASQASVTAEQNSDAATPTAPAAEEKTPEEEKQPKPDVETGEPTSAQATEQLAAEVASKEAETTSATAGEVPVHTETADAQPTSSPCDGEVTNSPDAHC